MVPDGKAVPKLEEDLFKVPDVLESEEVTEAGKEEKLVEKPDEADERVDVLVQTGWGSFQRRTSGAFKRISDGMRRVFQRAMESRCTNMFEGWQKTRSMDCLDVCE